MLLDLGAIAYWSMPGASPYRTMHARSSRSPQCIIVVGEGRLRISKAEGRPPGARASCSATPSRTEAATAAGQAAARVGAALRAYRLRRDLSQSDLARLAGSPQALSPKWAGRQEGLSLETLMTLSGRLNVTSTSCSAVRLPGLPDRQRHGLGTAPAGSILPAARRREAASRAYLVFLPRSATVEAPFAHKGAELVGVVSGLIQVLLSSGRPVLRRGETLLASRRGIDGCANMGEGDAQCLWVLRRLST